MGFQIDQTAGDHTWDWDPPEGETVTFRFNAPEPSERYEYLAVAWAAGDTAGFGEVVEAAVRLARKTTTGIDTLEGPDGEAVDWNDDEGIAEQFKAASATEARELILEHLGDTYEERHETIVEYAEAILASDSMSTEDQKKPSANSDDE